MNVRKNVLFFQEVNNPFAPPTLRMNPYAKAQRSAFNLVKQKLFGRYKRYAESVLYH